MAHEETMLAKLNQYINSYEGGIVLKDDFSWQDVSHLLKAYTLRDYLEKRVEGLKLLERAKQRLKNSTPDTPTK